MDPPVLAGLLALLAISSRLWWPSPPKQIHGDRWLRYVPRHLRPTPHQVSALEQLRLEFRIPGEALASRVVGSPVTTRRLQAQVAENLRAQFPEISDHELWTAVLETRSRPPKPHGWGWSVARVDQAMKGVSSFHELVELIVRTEDQTEPAEPDPLGLGTRIDEILSR